MEQVLDHKHNGTDSRKLKLSESVLGAPQSAISQVSGTAGATYGATEQSIINQQTTAINAIITKLQTLGLTL